MVAFVGKYVYERSEGLEEYLSKVGGPAEAEAAKLIGQSKPIFEVGLTGDEYTITVTNAGKSITNKFKVGSEFNEIMPHGAVLKTMVNKDGDKFTFVSGLPDGNSSIREYLFTPEGITVYLSEKKFGVKATRWYKRA